MLEVINTKKVIKNPHLENKGSFLLTMTCSKRLYLFKQVLPSFKKHCIETDLISKIIIYDDNSPEYERLEMERIAEELFPNTNIIYRYFNNIQTKYHHAYIMQHWYDDIENYDAVFHLEDDRIMNKDFSLLEMAEILLNDPAVATVNIAQTRRDFPEDYLKKYGFTIDYYKNKDYWIWPYVKDIRCGEVMFYDTVRCEEGSNEYGINYYEYFMNYAPFGLQPGLMDPKKIRTIEKFKFVPMLEADFGIRYSEKYITVCHNQSKSTHLGSMYLNQTSAYEMNTSIR